MQNVHTISESGSGSAQLYNAAWAFSSMNRKLIEPVDKKGNAQLFHLKIEAQSTGGACATTIKTASNGYVTKQAVKAWYRVWRQKFLDQGISMKDLGPYGRVFKPMLTASHDVLGSGLEAGQGDWNYSEVVNTAPVSDGSGSSVEADDLWDKYTVHLCGATVDESGGGESIKFAQVGMINSWMGSRKKNIGLDADNVPASLIFDETNPLLYARGGEIGTEAVVEEVRDLQADEPPYLDSTQDDLMIQAILQTNTTDTAVARVSAPCGLLEITHSAAVDLIITLEGITDM